MGIFSGFFKSRDKLKTAMTVRHTHIFSAEAMREKESPTEQPCSILQFMPA